MIKRGALIGFTSRAVQEARRNGKIFWRMASSDRSSAAFIEIHMRAFCCFQICWTSH
jgi:hypothetical protein